jgi:hypothetical protein
MWTACQRRGSHVYLHIDILSTSIYRPSSWEAAQCRGALSLLTISLAVPDCIPCPRPCQHTPSPSPSSSFSLDSQTSLAQLQNRPRIDHLQSGLPPISSSHAEFRSAHSCRANRQPPCRRVPETRTRPAPTTSQLTLQRSIAEAVAFRLDAKR